MNALKSLIAGAALSLSALPALAAYTITFGGAPTTFTAVEGTFETPTYGNAYFGGSAWMVQGQGATPAGAGQFTGSYSQGGLVLSNDPVSGSGSTGKTFLYVNIADGFTDSFTLQYGNPASGSAQVYVLGTELDDLNADNLAFVDANKITDFTLDFNGALCNGLVCNFLDAGASNFAGVAKSVLIVANSTEQGFLVFDNLRFGIAASEVPEPGSLALAGLALGGVFFTRRRKQ